MVKLGTNVVSSAARIIAGGLIAAGTVGGLTSLSGGGIMQRELTPSGGQSATQKYAAIDTYNVLITGTGGTTTTTRYAAACVANPLKVLGAGTGVIVRAAYMAGNNPAAMPGDIGFVKSCTNNSTSGATLFDNFCSATGCLSVYTTGSLTWNDADYLKVTFSGNPTTSYTGRLRIWQEDLYGE